jgi:hypothetical protein
MKHRGRLTAMAFATLSLGGILALLSQAGADRPSAARLHTLDPAAEETSVFRDAVPAAIEGGAMLQAGEASPGADGKAPGARQRLSLR